MLQVSQNNVRDLDKEFSARGQSGKQTILGFVHYCHAFMTSCLASFSSVLFALWNFWSPSSLASLCRFFTDAELGVGDGWCIEETELEGVRLVGVGRPPSVVVPWPADGELAAKNSSQDAVSLLLTMS